MATIAESNQTVIVCSSIATTPPSATLATDVVVSLSTMDGTGVYSVSA